LSYLKQPYRLLLTLPSGLTILRGPLLIKRATQIAQALKTLHSGSAREARTSARHGE